MRFISFVLCSVDDDVVIWFVFLLFLSFENIDFLLSLNVVFLFNGIFFWEFNFKDVVRIFNFICLVSKANSADPILKSGAVKKFSDYQGTGVGSNDVTFTFYFRHFNHN